jgi:hypothetical protein
MMWFLSFNVSVPPTPSVPVRRACFNRRMRRSVRRHRVFVQAGHQLANVQLPLPSDLISTLKSKSRLSSMVYSYVLRLVYSCGCFLFQVYSCCNFCRGLAWPVLLRWPSSCMYVLRRFVLVSRAVQTF